MADVDAVDVLRLLASRMVPLAEEDRFFLQLLLRLRLLTTLQASSLSDEEATDFLPLDEVDRFFLQLLLRLRLLTTLPTSSSLSSDEATDFLPLVDRFFLQLLLRLRLLTTLQASSLSSDEAKDLLPQLRLVLPVDERTDCPERECVSDDDTTNLRALDAFESCR